MQDEAGIALGQASLTVEEQATTIATLADNGVYHTPHVIKQIIVGNSVIPAKVTQRRCSPRARTPTWTGRCHADTSRGGTAAGLGLNNGQDGHRQDRYHQPVPVGVLHGRRPRSTRWRIGMFVNKPHCPPRDAGRVQFHRGPGVRAAGGHRDAVRRRWPVRLRRAVPGATSGTTSSTRTSATCPCRRSPRSTTTGRRGTCAARCPSRSPSTHHQQGQGCQGQGQGQGFGQGQPCPHAAGSRRRPGTPPRPGSRRRPATPPDRASHAHRAAFARWLRRRAGPSGGPGPGAVALAVGGGCRAVAVAGRQAA